MALVQSLIAAWDRYGSAAFWIIAVSLVAVAIVTAPPAAGRDDEGTVTTAGNIGAFQMQVGDCFNDDDFAGENIEVSNVSGTPCSEPHDNEVYAVFNTDLSAFPGREEMGESAAAACLEPFEAFVGESYETSLLDVVQLFPTSESWTQRGDREVVCAVFHIELQKLVGSVRGSGM